MSLSETQIMLIQSIFNIQREHYDTIGPVLPGTLDKGSS